MAEEDLGKLGVGGHDFDYDLFVIGGGSAGTRSSRFSAKYGAKVGLIELPYNPVSTETTLGGLGGTCVLRGCVPKKILVYGSHSKEDLEDAAGLGWELEPDKIKFNWKRLIDSKTREITRLNQTYKKIIETAGVTIFEGFATFVDSHTLKLDLTGGEMKTITSNHILIATGSRAQKLKIPGQELAITSDEALALEEQPQKVIVVGGGYIGVEFAGIYKGVGSEVHLMYRKDLPLTGFDVEMQNIVSGNLKARGINLYPGTSVTELSKTADGRIKAVTDKKQELTVDAVLFATGRKPNTKNLKVDAAGVKLDPSSGAVIVNEYSQTNVKNIWAAGDVTSRVMLTPVALMEGNCLANTLFGGKPTKPDFDNYPSAVFCQPNLSVVGPTEEKAHEKSKGDVLVFTSSFNPMKNTVSGRQEKSHMKLLVDSATDKVVGASMCGPDAPEIIQGIAIAIKCGATKAQFDGTVGIHPTAAEEFVTLRTPVRKINRNGEVSKL